MQKLQWIYAALLLLGLSCTAYGQDDVRQLDPFQEISVSGKLRVELVPGDSEQVEIYTEDLSPDDVNLKYRGNSLRISLIEGLIKNHEPVYVRVVFRELRSIRASAGAQVKCDEVIKGGDLEIKVNSGAQMYLDIEAEHLEASAAEGGQLELTGSAQEQDASASTGGMYDGHRLVSTRTYVRANTGGRTRVYATDFLDAAANTGGWIEYKGDPAKKYTKSVLAGTIEQY